MRRGYGGRGRRQSGSVPVREQPQEAPEEFVDFADDYLGADIIFWATSSPWLHQGAGK
ncbi:hypothetical protein [Streptomyces sp. NPDC002537]